MSFRNKVWHDRVRQLGVVNVDGDIDLTTSLGTFQTFADAYPAATEVYLVVEDTATGDWASGDAVYIPPTDNHITLFDIDETSGGSFAGGLVPGQNLIVFVDVNTKSMEDLDTAVGDNAGDIATLQTNSHAPGSDNQDASEVPVTPSGNLTSTDVQAALEELQADVDAGSDDQTAAEVPFTPAGTVSSTDVQAAIQELDGDIVGKLDNNGDEGTGRYNFTFSGTAAQPTLTLGSATSRTGLFGNTGQIQIGAGGATDQPTRLCIFEDGLIRISDYGGGSSQANYSTLLNTDPFRLDAIPNVKWIEDTRIALNVDYSNVTSGLTATDVQAAIDELDGRLDTQETASANHVEKTGDTMTGDLNMTAPAQVNGAAGTVAQPAITAGQDDRGLYNSTLGMSVAIDLQPVATFRSDGTIFMEATDYETLVTLDDHVPNKKYVDDAISAAASTDDQTAAEVPFTPYAEIGSTDVQAAIQELQDEKVRKAGDSMTGELGIIPTGSASQPALTIGGNSGGSIKSGLWGGTTGVGSLYMQMGDNADSSITTVALDRGGLLRMDDYGHLGTITTYKALLDGNPNGFALAGWVTDQLVAGNITVTPSGNLTSTDVQAALEELQADIDNIDGVPLRDHTYGFLAGTNTSPAEANPRWINPTITRAHGSSQDFATATDVDVFFDEFTQIEYLSFTGTPPVGHTIHIHPRISSSRSWNTVNQALVYRLVIDVPVADDLEIRMDDINLIAGQQVRLLNYEDAANGIIAKTSTGGRIYVDLEIRQAFPGQVFDDYITYTVMSSPYIERALENAQNPNVYGTEFASAQDLTVSVSNADIFFNKLTIGPTAPVVGGTYEIEVNYKYSGDDTGEDFEARLQQDAVTLGTIHKQEIYESGGIFGSTGTDQRMPHSMRYLVTLAANDTPTFTLDYRSSKAGSDVSIMDAVMTFKRVA